MNANAHNRALLNGLRGSVASFVRGDLDLDGIQAALQSAMTLLENDETGATTIVPLAEADIEEIRFTRLLDEQRSAVIFRLDELLAALSDQGNE